MDVLNSDKKHNFFWKTGQTVEMKIHYNANPSDKINHNN